MEISKMDEKELESLTQVMKALAHPMRLKILCNLRKGPTNVSELERLVKANQAAVSQQLSILRLNGLVSAKRENGFVYYSLDDGNRKHVERIMSGLCGMCE